MSSTDPLHTPLTLETPLLFFPLAVYSTIHHVLSSSLSYFPLFFKISLLAVPPTFYVMFLPLWYCSSQPACFVFSKNKHVISAKFYS